MTDSAINGKIDRLLGLKENVIIGRSIPAGTGMREYRKTVISTMNQKKVEQVDTFEFNPEEVEYEAKEFKVQDNDDDTTVTM